MVLLAISPTARGVKLIPQQVTTGGPQFSRVFDGASVTPDGIIACDATARCAGQALVQHTLVTNSVMTLGVTETMLNMHAAQQ